MAKRGSNTHLEVGAVRKEWGGRLPIAIVYPNSYYVGMSNLALHLFYNYLNSDAKIVCERIFLSDDKTIRSEESARPLSDFEAATFTFSFEADYLNIKKILGPNISMFRKERSDHDPLLFAGGPAVTMNPSVLQDIFDVIVVGEIEDIFDELTDILKERSSKNKTLDELSKIPGIYIPGKNELSFISRIFTKELDKYPTHSTIWTKDTEFGHMHLVEASRGCPWRCKFCATPPIYAPYRLRSKEALWSSINHGLPHRKHIGLIGSDVLGHPDFIEIVNELTSKEIDFSVSSLRVNRLTKETAELLARTKHKRITLGIEAGTERLRSVVNKNLSDQNIFCAIKNLARSGITNVKLYFMIGLPGETEEDLRGISALTKEIRNIILKERKERTMSPNISVVATPFVPKKLTPFKDTDFAGIKYLNSALKILRSEFKKIPNTKLNSESPKNAYTEYILSHGDTKNEEMLSLMLDSNVRS